MQQNIIDTLCKHKDFKKISDLFKKLDSKILSFLHYLCINNLEEQAKFLYKCFNEIYLKSFLGTITLTFGDVAESHVGMQKIGEMSKNGFNLKDITLASNYFKKKGYETIIIKLNNYLPEDVKDKDEQKYLKEARENEEHQAYVLIVRNGIECLINKGNKDDLTIEMLLYNWDSKMYNERKNEVQNKNARHNLNFDLKSQNSDFKQGKGTTIAWKDVPIVNNIRKNLIKVFGKNAENLKCEGNKYYDPKNTGIGYHGDTERRKVIGVRLGKKMNLHYMWYFNDKPRGFNISFQLNPGDIYCMTEKTVGTDWRPNKNKGWLKKRYTLRHAAGSSEYTTLTQKIRILKNDKSKDPNIILGDIQYKRKPGIKEKKEGIKTDWVNMYN